MGCPADLEPSFQVRHSPRAAWSAGSRIIVLGSDGTRVGGFQETKSRQDRNLYAMKDPPKLL